MLSKFFSSLYLKVFINIVVKRYTTVVYVELCNNTSIIDSFEDEFETVELNEKMLEFIKLYTKESPYHYISILDTSKAQGALPTCSSNEISIFADMSSSKHLCYDEKWTYYTSKFDINAIEKRYNKIGIDYIFSPFVVLSKFFKDKIDSHMAMFVLIEDNQVSLSVFDNSLLLYADSLDMEHSLENDELVMSDDLSNDEVDLNLDDDNIDLDDIESIDDMDSLDDFGDIEDLDALDDIDEFSEASDMEEQLTEEAKEEEDDFPIESDTGFNEDYQRFSLIQSSIKNFYKDDKYRSTFIETVYIADSVRVSPDLKRYLEEEMFLNVYIRNLDLGAEVCELAKAETNEI